MSADILSIFFQKFLAHSVPEEFVFVFQGYLYFFFQCSMITGNFQKIVFTHSKKLSVSVWKYYITHVDLKGTSVLLNIFMVAAFKSYF